MFGGTGYSEDTVVMREQKNISREIWRLLIPIILEHALVYLASVVTTAMIGRLLAEDISAQGISSSLYNMSNYLFRAMNIALVSITSYHFGKREMKECCRALEQAFLTVMPICLILVLLVQLKPETALHLYTSEETIIQTALPYVRLLMFSLIPAALTSCITASFQGHGDTRTPLMIAMLVNAVNIVLGWLLIFGKLGFPRMGLVGAGISLLTARTVGAVVSVKLLCSSSMGIRPFTDKSKNAFRIQKKIQRDLYSMSLPIFAENMQWQLAAIVVGRIILSYSINHYAAYQIGLQAEALCQTFADGFVSVSVLLGARAIGMGDGRLYRRYFRELIKACTYITIPSVLILLFLPTQMMSLLTDIPELIAIGALYVKIMSICQPPQNYQRVLNGYIRVSGHKNTPTIIAAVCIWGIRVMLCVLFGTVLHWDIVFIWWAIAADQMSRVTMGIVFMMKKRVLRAADDEKQHIGLERIQNS